ncbi:hypothetical protein CE91St41_06160 [Oscillospiraceae bacterium]|nr:hypothetical protein CE91St40_06160 [Oscillospiraceae bacterium]BDF73727.1 hypothetical protein CE91St41_06160 [Oscillospiraceae bacterium]
MRKAPTTVISDTISSVIMSTSFICRLLSIFPHLSFPRAVRGRSPMAVRPFLRTVGADAHIGPPSPMR